MLSEGKGRVSTAMPQPCPDPVPFPSAEFDHWAAQYDEDVANEGFPFTGYQHVLAESVRMADATAGMAVLDLGAGTGNLAKFFIRLGCEVWCTDFSSEMIDLARAKCPSAYFFLHDLRQPFPADLVRRFDRIVSAYVFHHFELAEKIAIIERLMNDLLTPDGRLVIADISFPTRQAVDTLRQATGDRWDDEPYWIVPEALPALDAIHAVVVYQQVSDCTGIYLLSR
jgi:putative AdoMet-dependent methyltransferase